MTCDAAKFYLKMDQFHFFLRKWFGILLFVSTQSIVIPPIIICLNGVRTGHNVTNEMCSLPVKISYVLIWNHPFKSSIVLWNYWKKSFKIFKFRLPFKIDSLSVYLAVSVISAFSIYSLATCKIMTAEVFYRYGLHLIARCRHLLFLLDKFTTHPLWVKSCIVFDLKFCKLFSFALKTCNFPIIILSKWSVLERSGSIEATSQGGYPFSFRNDRVKHQISIFENLFSNDHQNWKNVNLFSSFFEQYALAASGIIFFEFTTMIGLLGAAGTSMVIKVQMDDKFIPFIHR